MSIIEDNKQPRQTLYHYRLRYSRQEPAIWLAHLDMMRTFERSARRASWPMAWSQGYNPRPQMTFALPISVGLATEDDYFDVALTRNIQPAELALSLNHKLPAGFQISAAGRLSDTKESLMSLVAAADYRLSHPALVEAWQHMSAMAPDLVWEVDKKSKGKIKTVDIRPLVLAVEVLSADTLLLKTWAGSQKNLRPDLFLQALVRYGGLDALQAADTAVLRHRLWLRKQQSDQLISPLETVTDCYEYETD